MVLKSGDCSEAVKQVAPAKMVVNAGAIEIWISTVYDDNHIMHYRYVFIIFRFTLGSVFSLRHRDTI